MVPIIHGVPYRTLPPKDVDIQLISPRVKLINKRPDYLLQLAEKKKFSLEKKKIPAINCPYVLIQAFNQSYGENGKNVIPSDQFLLSKKEYDELTKLDLYLEKGNYLVTVSNSTNAVIYHEKIAVH